MAHSVRVGCFLKLQAKPKIKCRVQSVVKFTQNTFVSSLILEIEG